MTLNKSFIFVITQQILSSAISSDEPLNVCEIRLFNINAMDKNVTSVSKLHLCLFDFFAGNIYLLRL